MLARSVVFLVLILLLACATIIALAYGPFPLTVDDVVRATKRMTGDDMGTVTSGEIVFTRVRLPRGSERRCPAPAPPTRLCSAIRWCRPTSSG